jgi:hypothetical protein
MAVPKWTPVPLFSWVTQQHRLTVIPFPDVKIAGRTVKIKILNFDNKSMFAKNQNLYLIIYIMFVSQALRNLPRQEDCFSLPQKEYKYVTPEKI